MSKRRHLRRCDVYANGDPIRFLDALGLCPDSGGFWSDVSQWWANQSWESGNTLNNLNDGNHMFSDAELNQFGQDISDVNEDFQYVQMGYLTLMGGAAVGPTLYGVAQQGGAWIASGGAAFGETGRRLATSQPFQGLVNTTSLPGNAVNPLPSVTTPSISTMQLEGTINAAQRILEFETSGGPGIMDYVNELRYQLDQ